MKVSEVGVVKCGIDGRTHRLALEPELLGEAADWMDRPRAPWGCLFEVADDYLKEERNR